MADDNLDEISDWIEGVVDSIRFDRVGEEKALGRELVGTIAIEIADAGAAGTDPEGTAWAANDPRYAEFKVKHYLVDIHAPNVRTSQMLSQLSLEGQPKITPDYVEMMYGLGQPPDRTAAGAPLMKSDTEITDIEKAITSTKKGRPFYFLSTAIVDACMEHTGKVVARWIEES